MRLVRFTGELFVLIGIAVAVSCLLGSTQPRPAIATIFTNPDGSPCEMPCMFGIKPSLTESVEMLQKIAGHPITSHSKETISSWGAGKAYMFSNSYQAVAIFVDSYNVVQRVSWGNECTLFSLPTVADVFNALGTPSSMIVEPFELGGTTFYVYKTYQTAIGSNPPFMPESCQNHIRSAQQLDPRNIVSSISIETPMFFKSYGAGVPWRGFREVGFYSDK